MSKVLTVAALFTAAILGLGSVAHAQFPKINVRDFKRIDPTIKNSDVRRQTREFDKHRRGFSVPIPRNNTTSRFNDPGSCRGTWITVKNDTGQNQELRVRFEYKRTRQGEPKHPIESFAYVVIRPGEKHTFKSGRGSGVVSPTRGKYNMIIESKSGTNWGGNGAKALPATYHKLDTKNLRANPSQTEDYYAHFSYKVGNSSEQEPNVFGLHGGESRNSTPAGTVRGADGQLYPANPAPPSSQSVGGMF